MSADSQEARGLARGIVGTARVTAFGTSIVAPAASVITALVIVVSYAAFASPLVVLITFVASLCCALSIAEFARRVPSAGWAYAYSRLSVRGTSTGHPASCREERVPVTTEPPAPLQRPVF